MSETIPGGRRQRACSEGDILDDDDDDSVYSAAAGVPLNLGQRKVSTSTVLTTVDRTQNDDDSGVSASERRMIGPSERRRKSRKTSFKSIKKLMNRVMKSSSSTNSLNEQDADSRVTWTPTLRRKNDNLQETQSLRGSRRGRSERSESTSRPLITKPPNFTGPKWDTTPGTVGLHNHGNTCFMNAVLQCLGNTDSFVEYFADGVVKDDLKNVRNVRKTSRNADVTEHLSTLIKCVWSNHYTADISKDFKAAVGKANPQYEGSSQHDAQEFLLWLLDRLHEDLNTNVKKRIKPLKNSAMRSDQELAKEALSSNEGSFVSQLFQALHRSSLTCPHCGKHSNTFDPYLCVSLPLPQKCPRPVYINVISEGQKQIKIGLRMNTFESVKDLRSRISIDLGINESQMVLCQMSEDGFRTTYSDEQPLSDIPETETVYVFETIRERNPSGASSHYETPYVQILVVHTERATNPQAFYRFCSPTVLRVPRDLTYKRLQKEILHRMGDAVKSEAFAQKTVLFHLRVVDCHPNRSYLPPDVEMPLFALSVDKALIYHTEDYGPSHMKLVAEWETHTKEMFVLDDEDSVEEHSSVHQMRISQHMNPSASLDECFKLYTQEEKLSGDDAWLCPHCKKQQQGTIKTLGLWSLPDVLVVHLKRFKQIGMRRNKLNTLVNFPVENLDMGNHVVQRCATQSGRGQNVPSDQPGKDDLEYDLFAVCNHYGNMNGGHYTAFCKNPINGQWHEYDDTRIKVINEKHVVSKAAYLLFYQRRSLSKFCNQNLHTGKHWVFRMFANNNNNNHVPPVPPSPSSTKSVHFDTASPQQIRPHQKPVTPTPNRKEIRDQQPIKTILRPLTPQPPRKQNFSLQEHDTSPRACEITQEFRVRAPLVRQHSEPEAHKGIGACFSLHKTAVDSDTYSRTLPPQHQTEKQHSTIPNGNNELEVGSFRSMRQSDRVRPNYSDGSSQRHSHTTTSSHVHNGHASNHSSQPDSSKQYTRPATSLGQQTSPHDSPNHMPHYSSDSSSLTASPADAMVVTHSTPEKTSVMIAESKQVDLPHAALASPVRNIPQRQQERRASHDKIYNNDSQREEEPTRPLEERKHPAVGRDIQKRIDAFNGLRLQNDNIYHSAAQHAYATISRPPRPNTVQAHYTEPYYMEPRDNISISSLAHRRNRADSRDSLSVKSFNEPAYSGYGRRDVSGHRVPVRYRPHIHRGSMFAQMQARRSIEVPAPNLKESSV